MLIMDFCKIFVNKNLKYILCSMSLIISNKQILKKNHILLHHNCLNLTIANWKTVIITTYSSTEKHHLYGTERTNVQNFPFYPKTQLNFYIIIKICIYLPGNQICIFSSGDVQEVYKRKILCSKTRKAPVDKNI